MNFFKDLSSGYEPKNVMYFLPQLKIFSKKSFKKNIKFFGLKLFRELFLRKFRTGEEIT